MRVIILAAGFGSRLKEHTVARPKCLLPFGATTLLQIQLAAFAANGINDIHVVRGYQRDKIAYGALTYHENPEFKDNNILASLMCAESALEGDVIVCYSDILFTPQVVASLLKARQDMSIMVDRAWRNQYVGRSDHPPEEAESVIYDADGRVLQIAKNLPQQSDRLGEFIGMIKFTGEGARRFKDEYCRAKAAYGDGSFQKASRFRNAYLTDMIQEVVDRGGAVQCVFIEGGWQEIDTVQDYDRALRNIDLFTRQLADGSATRA